MSAGGWLAPLEGALDAAPEPVVVFVRDDDGGWDDARLAALLDVCAASDMPVDVALIPTAVGGSLAHGLAVRTRSMKLRLHQHGYDHTNHEPTGRSCEFGPARSATQLHADVARGRTRLLACLGELIDPVFTPPWNRCAPALAPVLVSCGLRVLSRDLSAGRIGYPGLLEVPVSVDWFGGRKGARWTRDQLGAAIAAAVLAGGPVGIMLHHAVTDADELADVGALLRLLGRHDRVRPASIMEVACTPAGPRSGDQAPDGTNAASVIRR